MLQFIEPISDRSPHQLTKDFVEHFGSAEGEVSPFTFSTVYSGVKEPLVQSSVSANLVNKQGDVSVPEEPY